MRHRCSTNPHGKAMKSIRFVVVTALVLVAGVANANANDVTIEVTNIAEPKGRILIAAYSKAEGWLKQTPLVTAAPAKAGNVTLTLPKLPDGDYAITAIHDLNGNNRLDMNAIGMPIEPYGFSNDAAGNFGPPTFDAAKVKVSASATRVVIKLN
jgi:uncharacterized protein (DUF2141 family)